MHSSSVCSCVPTVLRPPRRSRVDLFVFDPVPRLRIELIEADLLPLRGGGVKLDRLPNGQLFISWG